MRVVFVNRIAWPDEGATALYLTDVAEAVAAAGHETHVICGRASYRASGGGRGAPASLHGGVRYHRVPGARGRGTVDRALASALFLLRMAWRLLRVRRPDVVVGLTDPPFADVVAGAIARLRGARVVHWWMDVYPDVAVAAGVLSARSPLTRLLGAIMAWSLPRADRVVVLGRAMRRPALARGVPRDRIEVIENWAPAAVDEAARLPAPARREGPTTLLYSGTYGIAHDLSPLLETLRRLPRGAPVRLVLRATGARVADLRCAVADLPIAVEWRDPVALSDLAAALREADVHVVAVRAGFERLVVPSKVYAPLALGAPLLLVGTARASLRGRIGRDSTPAGPLAAVLGPGVSLAQAPPRMRREGLSAWARIVVGG